MATSKWAGCTTGVYSTSEPTVRRTASAWAGAMPNSISTSTASATPRCSASCQAQAMSNRLCPATPRRMASARSGLSAQSRTRL
ncbi:Uncharacterised protein [Mycobacteroides abscessus subsp. abscessus]|nr:Uncharacterised protein [Mycobacteroides abscessus subsp. abscessus]